MTVIVDTGGQALKTYMRDLLPAPWLLPAESSGFPKLMPQATKLLAAQRPARRSTTDATAPCGGVAVWAHVGGFVAGLLAQPRTRGWSHISSVVPCTMATRRGGAEVPDAAVAPVLRLIEVAQVTGRCARRGRRCQVLIQREPDLRLAHRHLDLVLDSLETHPVSSPTGLSGPAMTLEQL